MSKVLITGGAGFIGYHLAKKLVEHGSQVHLFDNFSRGAQDEALQALLASADVELFSGDMRTQGGEFSDDYDYIFHLAARVGVDNVRAEPFAVLMDNYELLSAALALGKSQKGLKRFVFASTSEVYAGTLQHFELEIPTPETSPLAIPSLAEPRASYMLSKLYGESLVQHAGLPFSIIRPHNVYGPRMGISHVIPQLLRKAYCASESGEIEVYSCDHTRTFCYVDDAVELIRRIAEEDACLNETLNVGVESPEISIMKLAETLLAVVGKDLRILPLPATPGSPARRAPDMQRTQSLVGFKGEVTLSSGIERTYEWYKPLFESGATENE